jgi:hypothetical protein
MVEEADTGRDVDNLRVRGARLAVEIDGHLDLGLVCLARESCRSRCHRRRRWLQEQESSGAQKTTKRCARTDSVCAGP